MDKKSRESYLNTYMKKIDEFLAALQKKRRAKSTAALVSAIQNLEKSRTETERELREIRSYFCTSDMEVDSVTEKATSTTTVDHSQEVSRVTKKKRSRLEMTGGDSGYLNVNPGLSIIEEIGKDFGCLRIAELKSLLDWINEGMSGTTILESMVAMVKMLGERLSTAVAEIYYIVQHGKDSTSILDAFVQELASTTGSCVVKRRVRDLLKSAEECFLRHSVEGILPQLHDAVFKDMMSEILDQCKVSILEIDSLLTLQNLPTEAIRERGELQLIVDRLREMEEDVYAIEVRAIDYRGVFCSYTSQALVKMDAFVTEIENVLQILWTDFKERKPKKTRV